MSSIPSLRSLQLDAFSYDKELKEMLQNDFSSTILFKVEFMDFDAALRPLLMLLL